MGRICLKYIFPDLHWFRYFLCHSFAVYFRSIRTVIQLHTQYMCYSHFGSLGKNISCVMIGVFFHNKCQNLFQKMIVFADRKYASSCSRTLMLSTMGKNFSRRHFEISPYFSQKTSLTFHANYLVWNVKSCFLGKLKQMSSIGRLLN